MSPERALAKLRRIQHHTLAINGAQPVPVAIKLINGKRQASAVLNTAMN